ncbi:ABC transporter ATP-binding protein [Microvirga flavescens]|uniref:ABC transporter ATP-binding protein n=1 Tax=Microvirga flavescens TaxID=2249811 RepID=UPI000DD4F472|nr:ABC transporter ATP-binding protein [Microvirga flavescens]
MAASLQPQSASPLVSLRGVGKTFANGLTALSAFDLDILPCEFISLLGPSGCGKSTILRLIAGLSEPTSGSLAWSDATPADHRSEIGYVFQDPTLMPWASVADNVWFPLRLRGVSKREAASRIDDILSMVGLDGFARAYPRELSGGMRMRVSIARALSLRPKLLLMDEPFAALDEITRFKLNDDLLRLKRELDCTIVFVTHSVYESVYLSDRIAVMTPRPGHVAATMTVDAPRERDARFRASATYAKLCGQVSDILARAMILPGGAS